MADILIRGMEMPESCDKCSLFNECWCMAFGIENWRKSYNKPEQGERLLDCPLVPLPEGHGRLVDAREVLEKADNAWWCDCDVSELGLLLGSEVTTIVPAEGGTEDGN